MATVGTNSICSYSLSKFTMNTSDGSSVSRLAQMQARFQQKQLQEKEQKLLSLYQDETRKAYQSINTGGGKVRQLFKERRGHHTGRDRSYPLEPLQGDHRRGTSLDRSQTDNSKPVRRAKSQARKSSQEEDTIDFQTVQNNNEYESGPLDTLLKLHGRPPLDENEPPSRTNDLDPTRLFRKLPNIGTSTLPEDNSDRYKTYVANKPSTMAPTNLQEVKKFPAAHNRVTDISSLNKNMSKMSTTNRKPETKAANTTAGSGAPRSKASTPTSASTSRRPTPSPTTVARPTASSNAQVTVNNMASSRAAKPNVQGTVSNPVRGAAATPSTRRAGPPAAVSSKARSDLAPCKQCGRMFAHDRIAAHNDICLKTSKKKRKVFDPVKQRLKGTEAEAYIRKGKLPGPPPPPKSNWRRKHEDFIANIRAAKVAQAHLAKGGKLSDLPPPPPMDTSDLIPCPHCGRKFNDGAAARHIPKCATMLHNKPKPGAAANKGSVLKKR